MHPVDWHVSDDGTIPEAVADAAIRGRPIVAHLHDDAPIDALAAELLEQCSSVVRYPQPV